MYFLINFISASSSWLATASKLCEKQMFSGGDLEGNALCNLEDTWDNVVLLIVDEASGSTVRRATKKVTIIEFPQPSRKAPGVLPPDASNERNTPSDDTERPAGFWANLQIQGESAELGA